MPHFDSRETIQFITFRLADSLPRAAVARLKDDPEVLKHLDRELDAGIGACWLRKREIAELVERALLYFDGKRYRLLAWCLMPNHVHVVVEVLEDFALSDIVGSWKSYTAKQANTALKRSGTFWHREYFDRFMRNEAHLARTVEYIEQNPVKAGLVKEAVAWPWSSARLRKPSDTSNTGGKGS